MSAGRHVVRQRSRGSGVAAVRGCQGSAAGLQAATAMNMQQAHGAHHAGASRPPGVLQPAAGQIMRLTRRLFR